jgi:hypothetical protein
MMTSRQRLQATLEHRQPDRVCVDLGATFVSGAHASAVSQLRHALIGEPHHRVRITHPLQLNGEIDDALLRELPVDVVGIMPSMNAFGFRNQDWKPWRLFDGTDVEVPGAFTPTVDANGDLLLHPGGDTSIQASARMPRGGHYFDPIVRQEPIDENHLDPTANTEEFGPLGDADLADFAGRARAAAAGTEYGVFATIPGVWGYGDAMVVPAVGLRRPRGIRDPEEWYISLVARKDYIHEVFRYQTELAVRNIGRLAEALGDSVQAVRICGADFGGQHGPLISPRTYREMFSPYYRAINAAIHATTPWKTFKHCDGSIHDLIPEFIADGFDILNPVQTSADNMDARMLKREFGAHLTFWGGGVETQSTLPFGTPDEVYREVRERIDIFNDGGGFVFAAIHNIQPHTPLPNLLAMIRALHDSRAEPGS